MYLTERKICTLADQIHILVAAPCDIDNYIALYRCSLKIADTLISHCSQKPKQRYLFSTKNIWHRLMWIQDFNQWAQYFSIEAEYVHRLEDGLIRWISESKYVEFRRDIHMFIHDAQDYLEINLNCQICLTVDKKNHSFELVS